MGVPPHVLRHGGAGQLGRLFCILCCTRRRRQVQSGHTGGTVITHRINLRSVALRRTRGSSDPRCILLLLLNFFFFFEGSVKDEQNVLTFALRMEVSLCQGFKGRRAGVPPKEGGEVVPLKEGRWCWLLSSSPEQAGLAAFAGRICSWKARSGMKAAQGGRRPCTTEVGCSREGAGGVGGAQQCLSLPFGEDSRAVLELWPSRTEAMRGLGVEEVFLLDQLTELIKAEGALCTEAF